MPIQATQALSKKLPLPKNRYAVQCIEEEYKESSKGNMMVKRTWEIVSPIEVTIGGEVINVAGVTIEQYLTLIVFKEDGTVDEKKVAGMKGRYIQDANLFNETVPNDFDESNPPLYAKGKVMEAILSSQEYPQTQDPTPEELAKGQKYGKPILDQNNKPLKGFKPQLNELLYVSDVKGTSAPY